jgi:hypothetical protein
MKKITEYIKNEETGSHQLVTTTSYKDGSFISVGDKPVSIEDLVAAKNEKLLNEQATLEIKKTEFAAVNTILKAEKGKDYAEVLADYFLEDFSGTWLTGDKEEDFVTTFGENGLIHEDGDAMDYILLSKTSFIVKGTETRPELKVTLNGSVWVAVGEGVTYTLTKEVKEEESKEEEEGTT